MANKQKGPTLLRTCNGCKYRELNTVGIGKILVVCGAKNNRKIAEISIGIAYTITPKWCPFLKESDEREQNN